MKLTFSKTAQEALDMMEKTNQNLFLTGKAGTGKSTLLDYFRCRTTKKCVVLAPTGVAALNVDGETIHSFFGLKPGFEIEEAQKMKPSKLRNPRMFIRLETIVIDEISMVRADLLDAVNLFLQKVRENEEPFGGVQMLFIGDLYQLPPVVVSAERASFALKYETPFFFGADVLQKGDFEMNFIELDKIYRQADEDFINILNAVRNKSITQKEIEILNERLERDFQNDAEYIYLMTTNADAKKLNDVKLEQLNGKEFLFEASVEGKIERNQYPTDVDLKLKVGAQIMFVQNDPQRRWVNGTIGEILEIDEFDSVLQVRTNEGKNVEVELFVWEISRYVFRNGKFEREPIGKFKQLPVKLAWAITIHKSQGKTFEKVVIDLGRGSFAHGQTYVAFSRCRTLEGIVLKRPVRKSDVRMDYAVQKFLTNHQYKLAEKQMSQKEKINLIKEAIKKNEVIKMVYLKANNEKTEREIRPILIEKMEFKGFPFLGVQGECQLRMAERVFNVDRILRIG